MSIRDDTVTATLLRSRPLPQAGDSKRSRGQAAVIGGSLSTPGAAMLAGLACLRVGAGVLSMAVPEPAALPMAIAVPEARVQSFPADPGRCDGVGLQQLDDLLDSSEAVLLGPGIDNAEHALALTRHLLNRPPQPTVLDAFALGVLADLPMPAGHHPSLILTPNHAEAARLLQIREQELSDDSAEVSDLLSRRWQATVSFQGVVSCPDGRRFIGASGHGGLGTSGSGDVLAGAIAGLLARGVDQVWAAVWGTHIHAAAGDRLAASVGRLGFLARELCDELPKVITELAV